MKKYIHALKTKTKMHPLKTSFIVSLLIVFLLGFLLISYRGFLAHRSIEIFKTDAFARILYFDKLKNPDFTFALGDYFYGKGGLYSPEFAEKYFKETIALDPEYPRAHYQLARVYFVIGKFSEARKEIQKEIALYPEYKRSYYVKGLINGYTGRLNEAIADFKQFIEWKPDTWAGRNDLAWIYFQKGDFYNAYLAAEEGLLFSPNNPWLLNTVGISLKNMNNEEEALKAFEKALISSQTLTEQDWGAAYPGNDPSLYGVGLKNMKEVIEKNISLITKK
jgi:tetratricopeptide (TPR) repeat protein